MIDFKPHTQHPSQNASAYFYVLSILILIEASFFSFYGISRHYNYLTSINDLGHMDQAVWGTLHGQPFLNTDVFNAAISRLGVHFDPVLAFFVPFYLLAPTAAWLILAQAIALPLAGLPIYFMARQVTRSEQASFLWASTCLLSPFILSAASWDFHPTSLTVPFIALAYLAVEKKRYTVLLLSCFFILLCKEHFGLLVFGFGLLWFFKHRDVGKSFTLVLLGLGHLYLVVKIIMPAFSPTGQHLMLSSDLGQLSRYGWLGSSLKEIVINFVTNPFETVRHTLFAMDGLQYLLLLLLPLIFLPVLGFEFLLPGAGDLLANLLSANPMPRGIFSYHSATLIPVLVVAAIYGSRRISRSLVIFTLDRQAFVAFAVTFLLAWICFPFFSLPGGHQLWEPKKVFTFPDDGIAIVKELVTSDMSLSVQANIGAHFTQRQEVYIYPEMLGDVDAVVLRLDSPTLLPRGRDPGRIASLAHHLQMDPIDYLDSIRKLLTRGIYSGIVWHDPWLIFTKEIKTSQDVDDIMSKIETLQFEWQRTESLHVN